jgi:hypothetical protein
LVLCDLARAEQFALLGLAGGLFRAYATSFDAEGVPWAVRRVRRHAFAVTWLGPGWVFDGFARGQRRPAWESAFAAVQSADASRHARELAAAVGRLRLGGHAERVLWAIHRRVLAARRSVVRLPDRDLGTAVWGPDQAAWPRHWRQDLAAVLGGLTWLHLAAGAGAPLPPFGPGTALLTHAADLRGRPEDGCDEDCSRSGGPTHHHFLVNVGRGFLGALEPFGAADAAGVRAYDFAPGRRGGPGPSLRGAGQAGRLVSVYLPAKLGDPDACAALGAGQHRLLQALVRETTRAPRGAGGGTGPARAEVLAGNRVPDRAGRGTLACPLLDAQGRYVGFNGNKRRKGLGYRLLTPGGWLAKADYPAGAARAFLGDLAGLAGVLGLTAVGLAQGGGCLSLAEVRALAAAGAGRAALEALHLRIYVGADYIGRWGAYFRGAAGGLAPSAPGPGPVPALAAELARRRVTRRALAAGLGVDASFLSKVLSGKKPCPPGLPERATAWLAVQASAAPGPEAAPAAAPLAVGTGSVLDAALRYLRRGWSVVPQRPGAKKPCVRWKRFQSERPTEGQLRDWFGQWPDAGLAVVLGPVSGLVVIDVDGPEAHAALVGRLGEEPVAPKALSGSGKPDRYHLYFTCPEMRTRAKATPWHAQLEFRGQGGIVVLPPSLHPSGRRYAWAPGRSPDDLPPPPLPPAVREALAPPARPATPAAEAPVPADVEASPSTLAFLSGRYANGPRWNDRLFRAACDLAARGVPLEEALPLLLAGARPWNMAEQEAAARTIASAYAQPRCPSRA